jgi:hypothetical protein
MKRRLPSSEHPVWQASSPSSPYDSGLSAGLPRVINPHGIVGGSSCHTRSRVGVKRTLPSRHDRRALVAATVAATQRHRVGGCS